MSCRHSVIAFALGIQSLVSACVLHSCLRSPTELSSYELSSITGSKIAVAGLVRSGDPCQSLKCIPCGGHGCKCLDSHVNESLDPCGTGLTNSTLNTVQCTPLRIYANEGCTGGTSEVPNCGNTRSAVIDP